MLGHPKYRHKEEKRKMLKMSFKKLQKMEDPESLLCKAVLINNTLNYLRNNLNMNNKHVEVLEDQNSSEYQIDIMSEIIFPAPIDNKIEEFNEYKEENDEGYKLSRDDIKEDFKDIPEAIPKET